MKGKYSLLNLQSNNILNEIISYYPEKKRILNITKYNKKLQNRLNISLYTYQKEYLNLYFKFNDPRKYNIIHLHNYFTQKNLFEKEKGQKDFIKIIEELFPKKKTEEEEEEEEEEEDENEDEEDLGILDEIEFEKIKEISEFKKNKNLTSIEIYNIKNCDLGLISSTTVKNLKIVDGKKIKMPFSLLNNLEGLIFENVVSLEIYDIPNNKKKLKNLKYLRLTNNLKINEKFSTPNLIYLSLDFYSQNYEQLEYTYDFLSYLNLLPEIPSKLDKYHLCPQLAELPFDNYFDFYFSKFPKLKHLYLSFSDIVADDKFRKMYLKFIEEKNNIFKCYYNYQNDDEKLNKVQSFFYDLNSQISSKVNTIDIKIDMQSLEQFLSSDEIKKDYYCLQTMEIIDLQKYEDNEKENFNLFLQKIQKFQFLRKIKIVLLEQDDEFLDNKDLEKIIKSLSELKLVENIYIKIKNTKIKLSKNTLKLFPNMTIQKKDNCLILFWKYK